MPSYVNPPHVSVSPYVVTGTFTDASVNEAGFRVERSDDNVNFAELATLGANVTGYQDANLASGRTVYYRVRAYNSGGYSPYSNIASIRVAPSTASASAWHRTWTPSRTPLSN